MKLSETGSPLDFSVGPNRELLLYDHFCVRRKNMQEDTTNPVSKGEENLNLISDDKKKLTWDEATIEVLKRFGPLHYEDITKKIIEEGLKENVGATPAQSVNSSITSSINFRGEKSPFVRIERGVYGIREKGKLHKEVEPEEQEHSSLIAAFGMYWSREDILWKTTNTNLWGQQQDGAKLVDFFDQRGIYILYDQNKLVYVGEATDRALGKRLSEHTKDRHKTRWDRFSWFGLKKVTDKGELRDLNDSIELTISSLIAHLEALLIEACEPVQNRQRGKYFNDREYNQVKDEKIEHPFIAGMREMLDNENK